MKQKRILAYVHAYVGHGRDAGAETTLANLLESLVKDGWEADVLLSQPGVAPFTHNGVTVRSETYGTDLIEQLPGVSAIITHLECSHRASIVRSVHKVPVIQLIHNTMWQTEGYLNEGCDLAIFNTEWVRDFHELCDEKEDAVGVATRTDDGGTMIAFKSRKPHQWKSVVLHPQIDPDLYRVSPGDSVTLVNLFENKGAKMFWKLAAAFPDTPFLAVRGGYGDQIIPDDIPENVEIIENTSDMRSVYSRTRVLLMPSKYESFGRVAVEAAASGIPTLASGTPGLEEALGPMNLYCDYNDFDSWGYRLFELLNDPGKWLSASANALERSNYWSDQRAPETEGMLDAVAAVALGTQWGEPIGR